MKKDTDSSIARKYIKENKDKLERKDIVNYLYKVTNLSKSTIQNIFAQVLDIRGYAEEKLAGKDGQKAKEFIKNNIGKMSEEELIEHLVKNTRLNELSAEAICFYVKNEENYRKKMPRIEEIKYKGRRRNFFIFDDSKLWREIDG